MKKAEMDLSEQFRTDLDTMKVIKHGKPRVTRTKTQLFVGSVCLNLLAWHVLSLREVLNPIHPNSLMLHYSY